MAETYAYQSPFNFSENRVTNGRELEGLEWVSVFSRVTPLLENSSIRPSPVVETLTKTSEASSKNQQEHFNLGRQVEKEQLEQMGLEKNNKTFEFKDPKTGKTEKTIPDAIKKDGGTVEIKNVEKQSFTKQLRGQLEISKSNGAEAILKIKEGAKITKPLENSGIKIQKFGPTPKLDNIKINPAPAPALFPKPKPTDYCKNDPNCA